ncbi:tyrosine-type recombinase/integrase [Phycisphaerales bacterium AB-hyl4]|uniref:Tyrosine-type recombinase/integrase n=1 Tax=Natronomicrosphaera hydrolytica TaxID=3242702 RepID=A0ABV4U8T9_9BACT
MALYKRDGSPNWWIEFEFNGQRVRKSARTANRRRAEDVERKLRQDMHDHHVLGKPVVKSMTFEDAAERYLKTHLKPKGQKAATARNDAYKINMLVDRVGGGRLLSQITASFVAALKDDLLKEGKTDKDGKKSGLAPATVNRDLAILKAILRKAHDEWGCLATVPRITLLPLNNRRLRWLDADEETRLLKACDDAPHLRDLVVFLMDTGARLTEATELTWDRVDMDRKPRPLVSFHDTKSGKPRSVPLPDRAGRMLARLHADRPKDKAHVFLSWHPNWKGGRHNPHAQPCGQPHGAWAKAVKRAKLEDFRIHDLRHTFASRLVQQGASLFAVSKLLGHESIQMTMRYAHLAPDELDAAISRLDQRSTQIATPVA